MKNTMTAMEGDIKELKKKKLEIRKKCLLIMRHIDKDNVLILKWETNKIYQAMKLIFKYFKIGIIYIFSLKFLLVRMLLH